MTSSQRRLCAEWDQLQQLARLNPGRLSAIAADDRLFHFTLLQTPARPADPPHAPVLHTHKLRALYPPHFPSVPLELYVDVPFLHPNVHPETGFVCLWDRHRFSNTIEHALHKLVAMMAGRLYNTQAVHVMQSEALVYLRPGPSTPAPPLAHMPLLGLLHEPLELPPSDQHNLRRSRLS